MFSVIIHIHSFNYYTCQNRSRCYKTPLGIKQYTDKNKNYLNNLTSAVVKFL